MKASLVQNAASAKQTRRAAQRERQAALVAADDAKAVMSTQAGRRFCWWLLGRAGIEQSVLRDGEGRALYWAGRQDMGHELQAHLIATDSDAYLLMQREAIAAQAQAVASVPPEEAGMVSEPPEDTDD